MKTDNILVNLTKAGNELVLHAPMPGAEPEDILVKFGTHSLTVHSKMRGMPSPDKKMILAEWRIGEYHRELPLPDQIDSDRVNVAYNNGVLTVTMPLGDRTEPREIRVVKVNSERGVTQGHSGQA